MRPLFAAAAIAAIATSGIAEAAPRAPREGPLVAAPIVSRGRRIESRPAGGKVVVDGVYRTRASWAGGHPSPARPSWIAIDLGACCSRILVNWTSSGNHDYTDRKYGAPADYRIETSADATNGVDGTWRVAAAITGNPVRTRAHAVDFAGQRWVRMTVTALSPDVFEWGLHLDEIDVHDLSRGGNDFWVFFGDSITSAVFDRAPAHQPSFPEAIARGHLGFFPAVVGAGFGSLHHSDAVRRIDEVLALNPDAKVVAIGFGSNDWDPVAFRKDLVEVIRKVRAAGRIPVVARIPFRADSPVDYPARLNAVVDAVTKELGLLPGPDLHGWFQANRKHLQDGLHPDEAGSVEMIRRWAEAAAPLYP